MWGAPGSELIGSVAVSDTRDPNYDSDSQVSAGGGRGRGKGFALVFKFEVSIEIGLINCKGLRLLCTMYGKCHGVRVIW